MPKQKSIFIIGGVSPKTSVWTSTHHYYQSFVQQLFFLYVGLIAVCKIISETIVQNICGILVRLSPLLRQEHILGTCRMRMMLWIFVVSCVRVQASLGDPTGQPSMHPSSQPSQRPSTQPSMDPTRQPSKQPSIQPSSRPSNQPSGHPSGQPSHQPSQQPSEQVGFTCYNHTDCLSSL